MASCFCRSDPIRSDSATGGSTVLGVYHIDEANDEVRDEAEGCIFIRLPNLESQAPKAGCWMRR
jgi:hypothetical protein